MAEDPARSTRLQRISYKILDATSRSIGGLVVSNLVFLAWCAGNFVLPLHWRWDPYPFIFLMGVITLAGYDQNVVIMWMARRAEALQHRNEELQIEQLRHIKTTMEAVRDVCMAIYMGQLVPPGPPPPPNSHMGAGDPGAQP